MAIHRFLHNITVIVSIISLLFATYTTILIDNFRTPEITADFLLHSNTYYYVAEIIKTDIRNRYSAKLRDNLLELSIADTLLNTVITQNLIQRLSVPVLTTRKKIAGLPLKFAEKNLIITTKKYTTPISQTWNSLELPPVIIDAGNKLIGSVPSQVTVVDTEKNPNSILTRIMRTRIFFENLQKFLTAAWILLILSVIILLIVNVISLQRLIRGFLWIFAVSGMLILIGSFAIPALASVFSSNPDPIAGSLKDAMITTMISYYFSQTIPSSIIYLTIAVLLSLVYRFAPIIKTQQWINIHLLREKTKPSTIPKRKRRKKR